MKTKSIIELRRELESWIDFNKDKLQVSLLDISHLLTIMKKYYIMNVKKAHKDKLNIVKE